MGSMGSKIRLITQVTVGVVLCGLMVFAILYKTTPSQEILPHEEKIIHNFELTDFNEQKFEFDSLKGEYKFVYFGFTYCPDICPASLNKMSNVLNTLEKYKYDKFKMLFISVDPKRDTPAYLKNYVTHFHKNILAVTGEDAKLQKIAQDFGAYYAIMPNKEDPDHYLVNHTSFIYIIGKKNEYITHFHLESTVDEIVNFIIKNKLR